MDKKTLLRRIKKSFFFKAGLIGILLIVGISLTCPLWIPHDAMAADLSARLAEPEWFSNGFGGHIFGCDPLGRDVLSRVLIGSRASLLISLTVVTGAVVFGTMVGLIAGMFGGKVDMIIMRICDIFLAVPSLILALCVVAILGVNFTNLIIVMLMTQWVKYARLVRGNVLAIRNSEYVHASEVLGAGKFRIMITQVLPNVVNPLIIQASQNLGTVILAESGLSYLGCGVPLPTPAWGSMISDGRAYIAQAPWIVFAPGVALMLTVLCFNFLGDGLRDVLDPRNKD